VLVEDMPDPRELVGARVRDRDGHDIGLVRAVHVDDHERVIRVSVGTGDGFDRLDVTRADCTDAVVTLPEHDPPGGAG
jgi:hypothetical protein